MTLNNKYLLIISFLMCLNTFKTYGENYQRSYTGKIGGKLNVEFHIENLNGTISGFYYYEKIGIDIKLQAVRKIEL